MENVLAAGIKRKLTKAAEEVTGKDKPKSKPKNVRKARPSCQKDERVELMKKRTQYKSIEDWNRKLAHMHTILTAQDGLGKYDSVFS